METSGGLTGAVREITATNANDVASYEVLAFFVTREAGYFVESFGPAAEFPALIDDALQLEILESFAPVTA